MKPHVGDIVVWMGQSDPSDSYQVTGYKTDGSMEIMSTKHRWTASVQPTPKSDVLGSDICNVENAIIIKSDYVAIATDGGEDTWVNYVRRR